MVCGDELKSCQVARSQTLFGNVSVQPPAVHAPKRSLGASISISRHASTGGSGPFMCFEAWSLDFGHYFNIAGSPLTTCGETDCFFLHMLSGGNCFLHSLKFCHWDLVIYWGCPAPWRAVTNEQGTEARRGQSRQVGPTQSLQRCIKRTARWTDYFTCSTSACSARSSRRFLRASSSPRPSSMARLCAPCSRTPVVQSRGG